MEDFVPWVSLISSRPPTREEEEDEDDMPDLVHNFGARKRKRGASFKRVIDATPEVTGEANQQPNDESSDVQAIVVSDLLEMGFHGQSAFEDCSLGGFRRGLPNSCGAKRTFPRSRLLAG